MTRALLCSFTVSALALLPAGCAKRCESGLPYYQEASFTPVWELTGGERAALHRVGAFSLTSHRGETITDKTVSNGVYAVSFFFSKCDNTQNIPVFND